KPGTWDIIRRKFWSPAKITFVLIFNFTGKPYSQEMQGFTYSMFQILNDRGLFDELWSTAVHQKSNIIDDSGSDPEFIISKEAKKHKASKNGLLVLAFLPERAAELYARVKRAGDIILGVPTQCIYLRDNIDTII
ncbi:hypothetical protein GG344DRAFT_70762, partial [Lentinula edodes]